VVAKLLARRGKIPRGSSLTAFLKARAVAIAEGAAPPKWRAEGAARTGLWCTIRRPAAATPRPKTLSEMRIETMRHRIAQDEMRASYRRMLKK
jgi:hypothetical protein